MSEINGILCIDKPQDYTSFDIAAICRRLCNTRKIGHTGTLDPMATGVLPILVGHATKALNFLPTHNKSYITKFVPSIATDTGDIWGHIISEHKDKNIIPEQVENILPKLTGNIMQVPPMYSAVKINGKRLYQLAREGKTIEREARPVFIEKLELLDYDKNKNEYTLFCSCSTGTYIRTIITDIGDILGCGAVMTYLRRTNACGFSLDNCISLDKAKDLSDSGQLFDKIIPIDKAFDVYPAITLSDKQTFRFINGALLSLDRILSGQAIDREIKYIRIYNKEKGFIGLGLPQYDKNNLKQVYLNIRL